MARQRNVKEIMREFGENKATYTPPRAQRMLSEAGGRGGRIRE